MMTFAKIHEVLNFINNFKGRYSFELEDTFSNGYCYWFAKILELRFNGEIYFNPDAVHFATLIEEQLFDIYGIVNVGTDSWFCWEDYKLKENGEKIIHSCILKDKTCFSPNGD